MQRKRRRKLILLVTVFAVVFGFPTRATPLFAASVEKVLYSFCSANGCTDGAYPRAGLISDATGNLYGTIYEGGAYSGGAVFQLAPATNGKWTETVVYSFCSAKDCADGLYPLAGLIFDAAGNLYGTTFAGGTHLGGQDCFHSGCGTVFELTPGAGGTWTEAVLHSFRGNGTSGYRPQASLVFDTAGNLYGTTCCGGNHNHGTVFELTPGSGGTWTEKVLHSFRSLKGGGLDGSDPEAGLIFDAAGNLYGTTFVGGNYQAGTVFQLVLGTNGTWTEKILHHFKTNGKDGVTPQAGLIFDAAGNLYGTTFSGGHGGGGTVFQLSPAANGTWTEKILHGFKQSNYGKGGIYPAAGLIFDASGNLYGTTVNGGFYSFGTVFELSRQAGGGWTEQVLYDFKASGGDGEHPVAGLLVDAAGNLYGTTQEGGTGDADGGGTVFEIIP